VDGIEREQNGRLMKLPEASRACGYTADHLRVLIRSRKLADYGRPLRTARSLGRVAQEA
jgi:hypothetical protein